MHMKLIEYVGLSHPDKNTLFRASCFVKCYDISSQNLCVPLRLPQVCSSLVISGTTADIYYLP